MKILPSIYDESYYQSGNYKFYKSNAPRYYRMAREIVSLLDSVYIINGEEDILDFGCGLGFLADGLSRYHNGNVYGYEISDYAKEQCASKSIELIESSSLIFTLTG